MLHLKKKVVKGAVLGSRDRARPGRQLAPARPTGPRETLHTIEGFYPSLPPLSRKEPGLRWEAQPGGCVTFCTAINYGALELAALRLIASGVKAILNHAPIQLQVPEGKTVENVDFTVKLDNLAFSLKTG